MRVKRNKEINDFFIGIVFLKVAYFVAYFPNTPQNYYYFTKYTDTILAVITLFT